MSDRETARMIKRLEDRINDLEESSRPTGILTIARALTEQEKTVDEISTQINYGFQWNRTQWNFAQFLSGVVDEIFEVSEVEKTVDSVSTRVSETMTWNQSDYAVDKWG